jgi:diguanylate cyclase (GGDEF)-like protein
MKLKEMIVLYVEDDLHMQELMKDLLVSEVKELHIASNGKEGYDLYEELRPDIVITDEKMPCLNGLDMLTKIKSINPRQHTVLFTALSDLDTLKKAIDSNIDKLFIKPLNDFDDFLEKLENIAENIFQEKNIEFISNHDALTGLYNRRKIDEELIKCKNNIDRYGTKCSIILIDLDKFKDINDKYGHLAGDDVLKGLARILKTNIRSTDIVARWGGEEFMIIAPNLDIKNTYNLAEKLRKEIESHKFNNDIKLTASFGLSSFHKDKNIFEIIDEADKALYISKSKGRNRVYFFDKTL